MAVTVIVSNPLSLQGVSDADQDVGKQLIGMRVGNARHGTLVSAKAATDVCNIRRRVSMVILSVL